MPEVLRMPEVAAGATQAVLSTWVIAPENAFADGDVMMTVETDKAVVDVEAETDGVLLRTLVDVGVTVAVGEPIAVYGAADESVADADAYLATLGLLAPREQTATSEPPSASPSPAATSEPELEKVVRAVGERLFASPLARRIAREAGIALTDIQGTGPRGRIRRCDVDAAVLALGSASGPEARQAADLPVSPPQRSQPASSTEVRASRRGHADIPNSRLRQAIARRLTESKQTAPHFYLRRSARVDHLLLLREEINRGGHRVSVNDLVVRAAAKALRQVPAMNVAWFGDAIRHFEHVDIAVAVSLDDGLVTPVVQDVDTLSLVQLATQIRELAERARARKLQPQDLEGGSISVTNLGMYGVDDFAAIINPPQAAILAVGAARTEPVVTDGELATATVMRLCLAVDHRPVDGAVAARWLGELVELLEHPVELMV